MHIQDFYFFRLPVVLESRLVISEEGAGGGGGGVHPLHQPLLLLWLSFSTRKHTSMASRAIFSHFPEMSKSKQRTTFQDCRVRIFRTTILEIYSCILGEAIATSVSP